MNAHDVNVISERIKKYQKYATEAYASARAFENGEDKNEAYRQAEINEAKANALADLLQLLAL